MDGFKPFVPSIAAERARILTHDVVNDEYRHLVLAAGPVATAARPGQFFQLLCPHPQDAQPFLRRPMSVYGADPAKGEVSFLYRVTGAGTRGLETLRVGAHLDIMGPLGQGFGLDPAWRHIVVLGRGVGMATLAPLAEMAHGRGVGVTAIFSARRPDLLASEDRFRAIGAEVVGLHDLDGSSDPAHVEQVLRGLIAERRADAFFTCGSHRLARLLQRLAREFGIAGQIALEQQMACGLGMCFSCVLPFDVGGEIVDKRVCCDGPVFDLLQALP